MTETKLQTKTELSKISEKELKPVIEKVIAEALENTTISKESELECTDIKFRGNRVLLEFRWINESKLSCQETYWNPAEYEDEYDTIYGYFDYHDDEFANNVYLFLEENIKTNF